MPSPPATTRVSQAGAAAGNCCARPIADKDQSYFLHQLGQAQMAATRFPLGELTKPEVRRIATDSGLPTARKKDSTGICFIGERDFREFLGPSPPGPDWRDRDPQGRALGEHPGVFYFTLGQREGLQLGGIRGREAGHRPSGYPLRLKTAVYPRLAATLRESVKSCSTVTTSPPYFGMR